jgi:uncharacterized protein DUF4345
MGAFSRFAPWINRLVLAMASVIFATIGLRSIVDPIDAARATGVVLNSALAVTTTRIAFGAFPFGFALFSVSCLISRQRITAGVSLIAILVTTVIVVRIVGVAADGVVTESVRLLIPEVLLLTVSVSGLLLESVRQRHQTESKA